MLENLNARVVRLLLAGAAVIIFLLGFLVCADIFGRAFFNSPVKGTPEMVSMSIVIICFLLAGYSVQSGSMIYTDVFSVDVRRARPRLWPSFCRRCSAFCSSVSSSGAATSRCCTPGSAANMKAKARLRVPVWPARIVVVVGSVLVVVSYGLRALRAARSFVTGEPDSVVTPTASTHI